MASIKDKIFGTVDRVIDSRSKVREIQARVNAGAKIADAEWEALAVKQQASSWKDEFVTIVFTAPFIINMFALVCGFDSMAAGAQQVIDSIPAYDNLLMAIVFAAVAIKWRRS